MAAEMQYEDRALNFACADAGLYGVLSVPAQPATRGVLVVVGGPQYRAGSHRQFTLLARDLAAHGVPVLRFDYRGMGDSDGAARTFESVHDDLRCAIDAFLAAVPSLREVVIWGLCDAASAAMFYAAQDKRVTGLVLLNPWARTEGGAAKATLKHYYRSRLLDKALWKKILGGRFDYAAAGRSFVKLIGSAYGKPARADGAPATGGAPAPAQAPAAPLPERMLAGFARYQGQVLFVFSGADLTAKEFLDMAGASPQWKKLMAQGRVARRDLAPSDHTFSRRIWRDQVARWTREWLATW